MNESSFALSIEPSLEILGKMVAKVADYNFEYQYFTLLVLVACSKAPTVEVFFKHYHGVFAITTSEKIEPRSYDVSQFIIFGYNTFDVTDVITKLVISDYDTSGKYVIVCSSKKCDEKLIFRGLAKYSIVNALVLKYVDKKPEVFVYNPIVPGNCHNDEPYTLNRIHLNCKNDCFKKLFKPKLLNMQRCSLIVSTFEKHPVMILNISNSPSGGHGEIIKLVADKLNATLVVKTTKQILSGNRIDKNWTGSLGDVYNSKAHSTGHGVPLSGMVSVTDFRLTYPYDFSSLIWVTVLPENDRVWEWLLYPLQGTLRLAILLVFAVIICLSCFMNTVTWRNIKRAIGIETTKTKCSLLFYSWIIFLGMPINKLSKKMNLRMFVCLCIWSSFILRCSYSSALIKFLKTRNLDDYIHTIYDAPKHGFKFGGPRGLKYLYQNEPEIYNNWIDLDFDAWLVETDKIINETSNFIMVTDKRFFMYNFKKSPDGVRLKVLRENLITTPIAIFNKKYSMLTVSFDRILRQIVESGFMQHMEKRFYRCDYEKWLNKNNNYQREVAKPLRNYQLVGLHAIFLLGLIISVFVFIFEVIIGKLMMI